MEYRGPKLANLCESTRNIRQILNHKRPPTQEELEKLRSFFVARLNERPTEASRPDTLYGIGLRLLEYGFEGQKSKPRHPVKIHKDPKLTQRQLHLLVLVAKGHRRFIDVDSCRADLAKLIEKGFLTNGWGELTENGRLLLFRIEKGLA